MSQDKRQRRMWISITLALGLFIGIGILLSGEQPTQYSNYLSKSPSPTGVKAFYTYLKEENEEVERWFGQPGKLSKEESGQALFMVGPYFRFSEEDRNHYQEWMEAGNTIILLKQDPVGYFNTKVDYKEPIAEQPATLSSPNGESFHAQLSGNMRLRLLEGDETLLSDERGTVALKRSFGDGSLIVALQPSWVTNGNILEEEHTDIGLYLLDQTEASTILFDEYVHGQDNLPTYLTVYPKSLLIFLLQLSIFTIFLMWLKGKRFGPIYLPREAEVRFGDERLQALAAWYMRSDFYHESLSIQEQYIRQAVSDRWGVSVQRSWEDIFELLKPRLSDEQMNRWQEWIRDLQRIRNSSQWSKKDYIAWSQKLEDIRKEVQEG